MIRIMTTRRVRHPLPIRTNKIQILSQTRHKRRAGTIKTRKRNHRSVETEWLNPGKDGLIVDDAWKDLPDVKMYRKKGMIVVIPLRDPDPVPSEIKPPSKSTPKKADGNKRTK